MFNSVRMAHRAAKDVFTLTKLIIDTANISKSGPRTPTLNYTHFILSQHLSVVIHGHLFQPTPQ